MGVRRCLARSLTSLAFRCALQRVQTFPAAIHSGRIPPPQPTSHGDGRLSHPLTTPDMVRSGRVLQPQLNLHSFDVPSPLGYNKIKFIQNAQASLPAPACAHR